jgi:hypothetical protein
MIMQLHVISAEDLRRALEQRAEIDLVSSGPCRIVYNAYLQLFRVYDGAREHYAGDSIVGTANAYNELTRRMR